MYVYQKTMQRDGASPWGSSRWKSYDDDDQPGVLDIVAVVVIA